MLSPKEEIGCATVSGSDEKAALKSLICKIGAMSDYFVKASTPALAT
jgi:hypothetical protein